jgi:SAM-dependent methyltransferase
MEHLGMRRSRILAANWYDYPQYYDIAVQTYTRREADFIQALCQKYCSPDVRRLMEPACGTGRLITEFAARGYNTIGFDLSQPALSYLRRRLARRRLSAETFEADMADFRLRRPVDAAYCTVSTFRHLLTERKARGHLDCVARSLRSGGIYVLGLHLLSSKIAKADVQCWTERRGQTEVFVTLRVLRPDLHRRLQKFRVDLLVRRGTNDLRLRHEFQFRTYTAKQFRGLLRAVPSLQLCDVYDFRYGIEQSAVMNDEMPYSVFVLRRRLGS